MNSEIHRNNNINKKKISFFFLCGRQTAYIIRAFAQAHLACAHEFISRYAMVADMFFRRWYIFGFCPVNLIGRLIFLYPQAGFLYIISVVAKHSKN